MVFGKGKTFEVKQPEETELDADGFVGVDPIYQNFANETDKPLEGDEEAEVEETEADADPAKSNETKTETKPAGKGTRPAASEPVI